MEAVAADVRRTTTGMRWVFRVGSVLVTAAGIQLFVLTDHTDRLFAWTIKNPLTAAFLGAFYFTALTLAALSAREAGLNVPEAVHRFGRYDAHRVAIGQIGDDIGLRRRADFGPTAQPQRALARVDFE